LHAQAASLFPSYYILGHSGTDAEDCIVAEDGGGFEEFWNLPPELVALGT